MEQQSNGSPVVLVILDGWGLAPDGPGNAVALADTPAMDRLWRDYPHTELKSSGLDVGLPPGQMGNSEVGHLNIGAAIHPVVLKDGSVMISTLENLGQRDSLSWCLWSIHPDGTNWNPIISSFISTAFHFQTQLTDGNLVVGAYYGGV